jgi:hypothetical protein
MCTVSTIREAVSIPLKTSITNHAHFRSSQAVTELETSDLPFRRSQNFPLFQNRDSSSDRAAGVPENGFFSMPLKAGI